MTPPTSLIPSSLCSQFVFGIHPLPKSGYPQILREFMDLQYNHSLGCLYRNLDFTRLFYQAELSHFDNL